METKIYKSYEDFEKRENKKTNGVSESFAKSHPDYKEQNKSNEGYWNCSYCYNCRVCVFKITTKNKQNDQKTDIKTSI